MSENRLVAEILQTELNKRRFITEKSITVDELFQPKALKEWTKRLLGNDGMSGLAGRIEGASHERLEHTVATYLLGIAIKEGLNLKFDSLPRIFTKGSYGDAFYFFWSVICLCHDLGYQYENGDYDLEKMGTSDGRCELFDIQYDMLQLQKENLAEFGIASDKKEGQWILKSLELAKNYSRIRRDKKEYIGRKAQIDHGIAGALVLYDALIKEYKRAEAENQLAEEIRHKASNLNAGKKISSGELSSNVSNVRFAACSLLIACTVARHNMWNAEKKDEAKYHAFDLDLLCPGSPDSIISTEQSLDQMLFLLDFMDTIDLVKGIYTREAEAGKPKEVLDKRLEFLLHRITICFMKEKSDQYRWESALKYREFTISMKGGEVKEKFDEEVFDKYVERISGLTKWLDTKAPRFHKGEAGKEPSSVTLYYPNFPVKQQKWIGDITDCEITALCLYEGSGGNGKAGLFYQYHNAYQTFNLLMMDDLEGEKVRVCVEGQNPYGLYIEEWKRTLEVMTDIFTAQCKYMDSQCGERKEEMRVYRVDRKVNFDMMEKHGGTFAFTSTSKTGYLKNIAKGKKNLILLEIILKEGIPFVDYGGLFGEMYVYSDEQEVLLPPFLKLRTFPMEVSLNVDERKVATTEQLGSMKKYVVELGTFEIRREELDESAVIVRLEENKKIAAEVLEQIRKTRKIPEEKEKVEIYCRWKKDFQSLVRYCLYNIGIVYGLKEK